MTQELLHTYLKGEANSREKIEVLLWFEASDENKKEYLRLRQLYDTAVWHEVEKAKAESVAKLKLTLGGNKVRSFVRWAAGAVAVIGLVLITTWVNHSLESDDLYAETIMAPQGQFLQTTLSDGTIVMLNSNSKLTVMRDAKDLTRSVYLEGEGYFEVIRNEEAPFVVRTAYRDVTVLGTKFNVMAYPDSDLFETTLLEGAVAINDKKSNKEILLEPSEKLTIKGNSFRIENIEDEDELLWRKGIYSFQDEALPSIFLKLEQYYGVRVDIVREDLKVTHCTGKFRQNAGIEHIMKVLQLTYEFEYEYDYGEATIVVR